MTAKSIIKGDTYGVSQERFLLIHEGVSRVKDCGRGVLVPSFSDGRDWISNCCVFSFPLHLLEAEGTAFLAEKLQAML